MSSKVIWLTGLPCSGKTTIAKILQKELGGYLLDGDEIRKGLCSDLGFSEKDRNENVRRVGEVAKLMNGLVIVALVSPYRKSRDGVRNIIPQFIEVYVDCDLDECRKRDVKGLYKKLGDLTPIYEFPLNPEVHINTDSMNKDECVNLILSRYKGYKYI